MQQILMRSSILVLSVFLLVVGAGCRAVVTVTPSQVTIEGGETITLEATSSSDRDTSFLWTSADPDIATVDQSGLVTGINVGQTTVTAQGVSSRSEGHASITVTYPEGDLSELAFAVDESLQPYTEELPSLTEDGPPRPLAVIVDEDGNYAEFVEDELILVTDDMDALEDFIEYWNGELLWSIDASGTDIEMPQMHLIRIDTSLSDPSYLEDDILYLDPDARGASRVSSEEGLNLIAASISEAVSGMTVGMNWVGRGNSLATRSTTEAATGPSGYNSAGPGYSPNAFDWNFLDAGSVQDIGVTEAWYLLARTGKLSNKVKIAILDMGFSVSGNADVPSNWTAVSNVPFRSPLETSNLLKCSGGNACPWHGTDVLGAAMGVPDNNFGGAGPGGPVATPIMVYTLYDHFTSIGAIVLARSEGARIVNMSYVTPVHWALAVTVLPFEIATYAARNSMVLVACAGNDGKNVDARTWIGWERTWWTPCENSGVLCVGGLARNSKNRHSNSNWGNSDVDIWAPYSVIVGPNPATGPGAREVHGTSFSSPYVAGVAALIMAANPSLSPAQVRNILRDTAHSSPDNRVRRYVNAYAAVLQALGATIAIESPATGASFSWNWPVHFNAFVHDAGRGTPTVVWHSSRDGNLGAGTSITAPALSLGTHTIIARATFPDTSSVQDTVTITVANDPPTVTITSPENGSVYYQGQPIHLSGTSHDVNEPGAQLADAQMSWYVDDIFKGNGHALVIPAGSLSTGLRVIKLVGTDGMLSDAKTVTILIIDNPPDLPPDQVNIIKPAPNHSYGPFHYEAGQYYFDMELEGNANDPEDGPLTGASLVWTMRVNDGPVQNLGTGASITRRQYLTQGSWTYDITLTATDSASNSTSATVRATAIMILK